MNRITQIIYYLGLLLAFSYVVIRGITVGITHDEALTYKIIHGDEILKGTANHHWLNTQLSTLSTYLFGAKEFALRLPNILSFGIFWFFLFLTAKNFLKSSATQITLLVLLCGNPFILDFFSLCRGYGLSIAFVTASMFYLFKVVSLKSEAGVSHYFPGTFFAILSLSANLNTLNYFLVALALMLLSLLVFKPKKRIWLFAGLTLISGVALYFSLNHLFFLKAKDELYFGTENIHTTIDSLICSAFYDRDGFENGLVLRYLFYGSMVLTAFSMVRKKLLCTPGTFAFAILLGVFAALIAEHLLFKSLYPINRSSLYLYPIILLAFLLNIPELKVRLLRISILTCSIGYLLLNSFAYNLEKTITWWEDRHVKEAMLLIRNDIKDESVHTIECSWIYEPMINYYRLEYKVPVHEVFRDGIKYEAEYLLVQNDLITNENYRSLLLHARECGLLVYKRLPNAAN